MGHSTLAMKPALRHLWLLKFGAESEWLPIAGIGIEQIVHLKILARVTG
jgi:hypothetical protein